MIPEKNPNQSVGVGKPKVTEVPDLRAARAARKKQHKKGIHARRARGA